MSVILGVNTNHAGSSASLVIDGVPVAALAEERLNRVKYYAGFPKLAISKCLEIAGLTFSDIDAVAVGRDSSANLHKKLEFALRHPTKLLNLARMRSKSKTFDDMKSMIASECDVDPARLRFSSYNVEHHRHIPPVSTHFAWTVRRNHHRRIGATRVLHAFGMLDNESDR